MTTGGFGLLSRWLGDNAGATRLERRLKDATTEAEDASRALEGPELLSNFQPYLEQKIAHRRRQMMLEKLRQRMRDGSIG